MMRISNCPTALIPRMVALSSEKKSLPAALFRYLHFWNSTTDFNSFAMYFSPLITCIHCAPLLSRFYVFPIISSSPNHHSSLRFFATRLSPTRLWWDLPYAHHSFVNRGQSANFPLNVRHPTSFPFISPQPCSTLTSSPFSPCSIQPKVLVSPGAGLHCPRPERE